MSSHVLTGPQRNSQLLDTLLQIGETVRSKYRFDHTTQLALEGGSNDVRANPVWNHSVPGWYTRLTFVYWSY